MEGWYWGGGGGDDYISKSHLCQKSLMSKSHVEKSCRKGQIYGCQPECPMAEYPAGLSLISSLRSGIQALGIQVYMIPQLPECHIACH